MNKTKILYVDDEIINLRLFEINLGKKYQVLTAESGTQGLDLISQNQDIAIVVSDMKMPLMNGIEFIKLARERFKRIKFYILTGFEITTEIQNALRDGLILKYFKKPFNPKEIESEIERVLLD